jgi:hypothetical protein
MIWAGRRIAEVLQGAAHGPRLGLEKLFKGAGRGEGVLPSQVRQLKTGSKLQASLKPGWPPTDVSSDTVWCSTAVCRSTANQNETATCGLYCTQPMPD